LTPQEKFKFSKEDQRLSKNRPLDGGRIPHDGRNKETEMTIFHGKQAAIVDRIIRLEELVRTEYWSIPVVLEMLEVSQEANKLLYEEYDDRGDTGGKMVQEAHDDFAHLFWEQFTSPVARDPDSVRKSRQEILGILRKLVVAIYFGDRAYNRLKEDAA
jgi:hypothetical protein